MLKPFKLISHLTAAAVILFSANCYADGDFPNFNLQNANDYNGTVKVECTNGATATLSKDHPIKKSLAVFSGYCPAQPISVTCNIGFQNNDLLIYIGSVHYSAGFRVNWEGDCIDYPSPPAIDHINLNTNGKALNWKIAQNPYLTVNITPGENKS